MDQVLAPQIIVLMELHAIIYYKHLVVTVLLDSWGLSVNTKSMIVIPILAITEERAMTSLVTTLAHAHLKLKEVDVKRICTSVAQVHVSTAEFVLIELVLLSVCANLGIQVQDVREISMSNSLFRACQKTLQTVYS